MGSACQRQLDIGFCLHPLETQELLTKLQLRLQKYWFLDETANRRHAKLQINTKTDLAMQTLDVVGLVESAMDAC